MSCLIVSIVWKSRSYRNWRYRIDCLQVIDYKSKKDFFEFFVPQCTWGMCLQSLEVSFESVKYVEAKRVCQSVTLEAKNRTTLWIFQVELQAFTEANWRHVASVRHTFGSTSLEIFTHACFEVVMCSQKAGERGQNHADKTKNRIENRIIGCINIFQPVYLHSKASMNKIQKNYLIVLAWTASKFVRIVWPINKRYRGVGLTHTVLIGTVFDRNL